MALDPDYSQNITSSYVLHRLPRPGAIYSKPTQNLLRHLLALKIEI